MAHLILLGQLTADVATIAVIGAFLYGSAHLNPICIGCSYSEALTREAGQRPSAVPNQQPFHDQTKRYAGKLVPLF